MINETIRQREKEIKELHKEIIRNSYGEDAAERFRNGEFPEDIGVCRFKVTGKQAKYIIKESRTLGISIDAFVSQLVDEHITKEGSDNP